MNFGETQILNAKIKFTFLGIEDGEFACQIGFETQGGYNVMTDKFVPNDISLKRILNTLEVRSWEELQRKFARIKVNGKRVISIGNLIEDRWVDICEM